MKCFRDHTILDVLERAGVRGRRIGAEIRISCPDPDHADEHPSCDVHPERGVFHCRSCDAHGGIKDLAELLRVPLSGGYALRRVPTRSVKSMAPPAPKRSSKPKPRRPPEPRLTLPQLAQHLQIPVKFLASLGWRERPDGIFIPYWGLDGAPARSKVRHSLHVSPRFTYIGQGETILYGLWRLKEARAKRYLLLTEGESDCLAAWTMKHPAVGFPGKSTAGKLQTEYLMGIRTVYICVDADEAGEEFRASLVRRLSEMKYGEGTWDGEILAIEPAKHRAADLNDLRIKGAFHGPLPHEARQDRTSH